MALIPYSEQLRDPRWQKKRLKIFERDNFTCQLCGDTETSLNVHHNSYNGKAWEVEDTELITLCELCHLVEEKFKNLEDKPNEKIKKVVRLSSKNVDFEIIVVVFDDTERLIEFYYFLDYHPSTKLLEYQYCSNEVFMKQLNEKLYG